MQELNDTDPAVAFLPYGRRVRRYRRRARLNSLSFPLGRPERLSGDKKSWCDLSAHDHLIIFPENNETLVQTAGVNSSIIRTLTGIRAQISLLAACEPLFTHAEYFESLRKTHRRFFRVLTRNQDLIQAVSNAMFFPYGSTFVPEWNELEIFKTRHCSLIASEERRFPGHRLRHRMADWAAGANIGIDLLGRGYRPFQPKAAGLAPYRFSVVIENNQEQHYFSEKIVDALLCKTVPIYWGCPNIADFFDISGMIICQTEEDLRKELVKINEQRYHRNCSPP